jgi:hypothetical protein
MKKTFAKKLLFYFFPFSKQNKGGSEEEDEYIEYQSISNIYERDVSKSLEI